MLFFSIKVKENQIGDKYYVQTWLPIDDKKKKCQIGKVRVCERKK